MILPLSLFVGSFLFYLVTLNGTIPVYRDSGDLISAVSTLGIAHPPGYPLYILLGKLFAWAIPFGTAAYRLNLFSACCAAGTAGLLGILIKRTLIRRHFPERLPIPALAIAAAALYAITPAVQNLARVSEMYTLAALFAAGILLCCEAENPRYFLLGSFLLGSGFAVHPTLLFLAPVLVVFEPRTAVRRLGFFVLGFSVVLFLLVRSRTGPVQNWGDPSTLENLWRLITRSNYGGLKLHPEESHFSWTLSGGLEQAVYFFRMLIHQWGWVCCLAGLVGGRYALRDDRRLVIVWLLAGPCFVLLSNLPITENTTGPILEPYFLLVNLIWAIWVARGFGAMLQKLKGLSAQAALLIVLITVPLAELRGSFQSYRNDFYAYDLGRNILRTLPPQAVLYDPDDPIAFTLRALQVTEHRREDVALLNFFRTRWGYQQILKRWPDLLPPIPVNNAQDLEQLFWSYSMKQRPFFADLPMKVLPPLSYASEGLVYRIEPAPRLLSPRDLEQAEIVFEFYVWRGDWRTTAHPDFFIEHLLNYRSAARCNLGLKYAERQEWEAARRHYWEALVIDPHLSAAYNDLGVADFNQGRFEDAVRNYTWALADEPGNAGYQRNLELTRQRLGRGGPR